MPTTTSLDPATLMQAAFESIQAKDLDALASLWDEESYDVFNALGIEVRGPAELRAFFDEMFTAIEDLVFEIEDIHSAGDDVAVGQWHLRGTFSGGPFQGIEPTGRQVDLRGIDVMQFEDGMLRRNDVYYDGLTFARQIGLLPPADSPADKGLVSAFNTLTKAKAALRKQFG